ncbi:sensor histidine kinase [Microbacterium fluvii]|uniref:Sensor histidine kinase n=1 Tax=Microbacterium fluvii TaxID=415215 RepID=A0ABW2HDD3_9MICO|nr:ATP-binding protein [Microbacterium fluvii]MCU4671404.1 ATP-binding protein [Microbacterium fluvii]
MTADAGQGPVIGTPVTGPRPAPPDSALDVAWGQVRIGGGAPTTLGSFTRRRIERVITLAVGGGSLVLGVQAFLAALGPGIELPGWHLPLVLLCFVPLGLMLVACAVGRLVGVAAGMFASAFVLTLLLWPFATAGAAAAATTTQPWIWYLVNIATVSTVLAFPLALQVVWTIGIPVLYGVVVLVQIGFAQKYLVGIALDVSFALILGGMLWALGWMFRSIAAGVDAARGQVVESYALAAAEDAREQERVAVAALMHDSVLAALIAAERAHSPRERDLAVGMAREALTRLANTERDLHEGSDAATDAAAIAADIEHTARELGVDLSVERTIAENVAMVPGRVARALVLASAQAVANAVQHADGAGLTVAVGGDSDPVRVRIEIADDGTGFDLASVPDDRLGIRASIIARVAAVGGTARIRSDEQGTRVVLSWQEDPQ